MAHRFCRALLASVMADVREKVPATERRKAWAWSSARDYLEFHGPGNFFWHGRGCCLWHARAQGWETYLADKEG